MHAEKCPICNGTGRIRSEGEKFPKPCHGCQGLGWISIRDEPIISHLPPLKTDVQS